MTYFHFSQMRQLLCRLHFRIYICSWLDIVFCFCSYRVLTLLVVFWVAFCCVHLWLLLCLANNYIRSWWNFYQRFCRVQLISVSVCPAVLQIDFRILFSLIRKKVGCKICAFLFWFLVLFYQLLDCVRAYNWSCFYLKRFDKCVLRYQMRPGFLLVFKIFSII